MTFFIAQGTGTFGVIDRLKFGEWEGRSSGDWFTQSLNLLQIFVSAYLFWAGYNRSKRLGRGEVLLLSIVVYLLASVLWSVDPQTTLRRAVIYLFFVMGVIGIANSLSGNEYMQLMRRIIFISVVASLAALAIPSAGAFMADGTFRGIYSHKNVMGQVMAAGVLASLHGIRTAGHRRLPSAALGIMFTLFAVAARSATSLMTIFALVGGDVLIALFRRGGAARVIMLTVFVPILAILAISPDVLLSMLGKDATLTGRTELWEYVDVYIPQRPLLGWGFAAFWSPINPIATEISTELGWTVPEAHNGLRELLLQVGGIGTALFLIVAVRNIRSAVRCLRTSERELGRSFLLCCGGLVLIAMTEEVFVDPSQISVGMFFIMGLICERTLRVPVYQQRYQPATSSLHSALARGPDLQPRRSRPSAIPPPDAGGRLRHGANG